MEPLISFVTALILSLSLWLGGGAAPGDAVLVGPAALQTLTETYPAETARITEHTGSALRWIDETNLETVKRTAIANLDCEGYDFSGFLSDLALLCAEARLDAACAAAEAPGKRGLLDRPGLRPAEGMLSDGGERRKFGELFGDPYDGGGVRGRAGRPSADRGRVQTGFHPLPGRGL